MTTNNAFDLESICQLYATNQTNRHGRAFTLSKQAQHIFHYYSARTPPTPRISNWNAGGSSQQLDLSGTYAQISQQKRNYACRHAHNLPAGTKRQHSTVLNAHRTVSAQPYFTLPTLYKYHHIGSARAVVMPV
eukprot:gene10059-2230_t